MLAAAGGRRGLTSAAKDGANPGDQLARIERLGQVVVSADLQAQDAIDRFASRGKQQDRDGGLLPQRLQQLESGAPGKHHIQNNQFVLAG